MTNGYHQAFTIKLMVFCAILLIAARNKLVLTPSLSADPEKARGKLRRSIDIEIFVAAAILLATAFATSFSLGNE